MESSFKRTSPSRWIIRSTTPTSFGGWIAYDRSRSGLGMSRRLYSRVGQRTVENGADLAERQCAIDFFAIDEKRWGGVYAERIAFVNRSLHRVIILRLDA